MDIKITLKAARINANMTREEVAHAVGKSMQTITNWETGKTDIKYRDLLKLAKIYQVPIDQFRLPQ